MNSVTKPAQVISVKAKVIRIENCVKDNSLYIGEENPYRGKVLLELNCRDCRALDASGGLYNSPQLVETPEGQIMCQIPTLVRGERAFG